MIKKNDLIKKEELWVDDYGFTKVPYYILENIGIYWEPKIGFNNYNIYAEVDEENNRIIITGERKNDKE